MSSALPTLLDAPTSADFERNELIAALDEARSLTLLADPEKFIPALQQLFAACGVAVVFVRAPKGCPASGAVRWVTPESSGIESFAKRIGIAPGIVVGRMQKEALVDWSKFNDLKVRYRWTDTDE